MKENLIRIYYYIERGLDILNTFRNLFLAIFAIFISLHFVSFWWLIGMFGISIPILAIVGYYNVHLISKVRDRLSIKYGTHYGIQQFDLLKEQVRLLKEINKKL